MNRPDTNHLHYLAHVDGLRALAVLAVIFYHAGLGFGGGFVGVDVFFVISGYLITGLILTDLKDGKFHITEFWERRIRRILPALAVVVVFCLLAGWFLFFPQDFKELGQSVLAQATLASNIYFYFGEGYFAQGAEVKPLLHTWSLAVEEQFYLLFPFLLLVVWRFWRRYLIPTFLLLGIASFGMSVYGSYAHPRANFYLLPSRAWELLTGAFLAALPAQATPRKWITEPVALGGLIAILCAVLLYNRATRFPGLAAALPCFGAAMIIWANGSASTVIGRMLAMPAMVFIGKISYSLYLWHWPALVFYKYRMLEPVPAVQRLLLLVASGVVATLSWKFVETPVRKRVVFQRRPAVFVFGAATTAVLLLGGLAIFALNGIPSRIPPAALHYLSDSMTGAGTTSPADRQLSLQDAVSGNFNQFGATNTNMPVGLFVWGDSHAEVELPVLDVICKEHSVRGLAATHSQTAPLVGFESKGDWSLGRDSIDYNNAVADFIRRQPVSNVLIIARWDYYVETDKGTARLHRGLLDTIDSLRKSGAKIWVMRQVPRYPWNVPKALASAVLHGENPQSLGLTPAEEEEQARTQDPIFEGAERHPEVTILDPAALFVDASGRCRVAKDGEALYFDTDHVNLAGNRMLRPLFEPIIETAGKATGVDHNSSTMLRATVGKLSFRQSE
jgi:peptidoglycan/LPS O-acetylase OafA/YrhL